MMTHRVILTVMVSTMNIKLDITMLKNILFVISMLFVHQAAFAHAGGHGPVNEEQAMVIAADIAEQFVNFDPGLGFGKLDKSWKHIPAESRRIHKQGEGYYIVSITNKQVGKVLYLLLSISGEVYDANFTGKFPGLK